jgi:hypothetical protein
MLPDGPSCWHMLSARPHSRVAPEVVGREIEFAEDGDVED